jgi:hypothetical protein
MPIKKLYFFILPILFLLAATASAAGLVPDCGATGNCQLNDFLQVGLLVVNWIFGVVGPVVLFFFILGGFFFIFSSGESGKVEKGKNMIIGSVVGLIIMFASYVIIQFAMTALGVTGTWQISGWFKG